MSESVTALLRTSRLTGLGKLGGDIRPVAGGTVPRSAGGMLCEVSADEIREALGPYITRAFEAWAHTNKHHWAFEALRGTFRALLDIGGVVDVSLDCKNTFNSRHRL